MFMYVCGQVDVKVVVYCLSNEKNIVPRTREPFRKKKIKKPDASP